MDTHTSDEKFYAKLTELRNHIRNNTSIATSSGMTTTVPVGSMSTSKPYSNTFSLTNNSSNELISRKKRDDDDDEFSVCLVVSLSTFYSAVCLQLPDFFPPSLLGKRWYKIL